MNSNVNTLNTEAMNVNNVTTADNAGNVPATTAPAADAAATTPEKPTPVGVAGNAAAVAKAAAERAAAGAKIAAEKAARAKRLRCAPTVKAAAEKAAAAAEKAEKAAAAAAAEWERAKTAPTGAKAQAAAEKALKHMEKAQAAAEIVENAMAEITNAPEKPKRAKNFTRKAENSGWRAINNACHTLNQVLRMFGGLMGSTLAEYGDLDGKTVAQFLAEYGIKPANGKLSVSDIRGAWSDEMKPNNELAIFASVRATFTPREGHELFAGDKTCKYFVCTRKEAEQYVKTGECKFIAVHQLQVVGKMKWDIPVIARGLKQTRHIGEHTAKVAETSAAWDGIAETFIVFDVVNAAGEVIKREMRAVPKSEVVF